MFRVIGRRWMPPKNKSLPSAGLIAFAGAVSLGVAVGVGRFAFTPLLPLMLQEGTVDLAFGSHLATANYFGYLMGAMICMAMPRRLSAGFIIQVSLAATVLLTAAMALPLPALWLPLRFLAGMASATAFVFTSGWCLAELAFLNAPSLGSLIFAGPGAGIALSGLATTVMISLSWHAANCWLAFACITGIASALVWRVFVRTNHPIQLTSMTPALAAKPEVANDATPEMTVLALAYGLAGFGYIITATFLPVIARKALPNSIWLDLFWPVFGLAAFVGAILATRLRPSFDARLVLASAYFCQAGGILLIELFPSVIGFVIGSLLVGLPFTAISYFAMQQVRRLRPRRISRFMGLLTALYGLGQIAGPPVAGWLLTVTASEGAGFALSQAIASATLLIGGGMIAATAKIWPGRETN